MRSHRRLIAAIAATGLGAVGLAVTQSAEAAEERPCNQIQGSVDRVLECVTLEGVLEHEQAFQDIADANNGTRASGTSGFDASLDYVEERMKGAGYSRHPPAVRVPCVRRSRRLRARADGTRPGDVRRGHRLLGHLAVGTRRRDRSPSRLSTSTWVWATPPPAAARRSDFADFPDGQHRAPPAWCLHLRGQGRAGRGPRRHPASCSSTRAMSTTPVGSGIPAVTLSNDYTGGIPALNLTYALGEQLAGDRGPGDAAVRKRDPRVVDHREPDRRLQRRRSRQPRDGRRPPRLRQRGAWHQRQRLRLQRAARGGRGAGQGQARQQAALRVVVGRGGQPRRVDVLRGPALRRADRPARDVPELRHGRLAELRALHPATATVPASASTGPDGSDDIEALFERYYAERGVPSEPAAFTGRSDYQAFINNGIPSGGLFTGADGIKTAAQVAQVGRHRRHEQYDQCYHQACDDHRQHQPHGAEDQRRRDGLRHLPLRLRPGDDHGAQPGRVYLDAPERAWPRRPRQLLVARLAGRARRRGAARSACPRCGCRRAGSPCPAAARRAARRARSRAGSRCARSRGG